MLGRGPSPDGDEPRVRFLRQRPSGAVPGKVLTSSGLSRRQLLVEVEGDALRITRIGQNPLEVNGRATDIATVVPGDVVFLRPELLLFCTRRPAAMPPLRLLSEANLGEFGEPDANGIVGEAPMMWRLREQLAFAARSGNHLLLLGASGTGKELAARAVHRLSARAQRPFVSRSAATLPAGLIDAELFGNARNYPNVGMPERRGLIGDADGGTLFLDEIGELPSDLQSHLLRVLDDEGEYQRLGDAATSRSSFRLIGATNRDPSVALKHDFAARFSTRVELPSLGDRREDIPSLVRHLLLRAAQKSEDIARPFVGRTASGFEYARVDAALVAALLRRDYTTNLRELDAILWQAMAESAGDVVEPPAEIRALASDAPRPDPAKAVRAEPGAESIRAALLASRGRITAAARALGLSSRYALYRLMKKHGIEPAAGEGGSEPPTSDDDRLN
ncbi:MAG: sigma-54-dependent Fis family transcriptional regulator [Deltaproteobacteria bacterium]|nr:sigma-54-dependent Fis family transcriptional regulator [Deltaproteobacteria bacterium]